MEWWEELPIGSENLPFDELAQGNVGGALTAPFSAAFNLLDLPLSAVKEGLGQAHNVVQGEGLQGVGAGRHQWEEGIKGLNEADLGPLGFAKSPIQIALELGLDPTTYFGVGLAKKLSGGARTLAAAPEMGGLASAALRGTATGIDVANFALNEIPERALGPAIRGGAKIAKRGVEKIAPTAFEETPQTQLRKFLQDASMARQSQIAAKQQHRMTSSNPMAALMPWVRPGKSLAPIDKYSIPPFYETAFDSGVSRAVKSKAWEAHQRLAAKYQSFPDIPGINTPGMSGPEGWANIRETNPMPGIGMKRGWKESLDQGRSLGFANIPRRQNTQQFVTPFDLKHMDEQDLRDMAQIAAAVIMDFDNDNANKMFASLRQTGPGFQEVKKEIVSQFGPGIEPALPAMFDDLRRLVEEQGGSLGEGASRFFTAWGFPENTVSTKRLDALQKKVDSNKISREQAYAWIMGRGFSKGKPQIVETAAGMGAGHLATLVPEGMRVHPTEGQFSIPGMDPSTRRAEVNPEFRSQFERNKESYTEYVKSLWPGLPDEEIEVLRRMSIEAIYDEMMNAATEFSGGKGGATALLRAGESLNTTVGKTKDLEHYTKISMYPGDNPAAIGNQLEDMPLSGQKYVGEKPTLLSLNIIRAEELNIPIKKSWTNERVVQEIRKHGGLPWEENPKGGGLLSLQQLIQHYMVGKDIQIVDVPSDQWYKEAADAVIDIVGPGNYEDAMVLMELMAVTSSSTAVKENAENAIRAFAEWKLGSDEYIRKELNLSPDQVDAILGKGGRWQGTFRKKVEEDDIFMSSMSDAQKRAAGKVMGNYIERRTAADPSWSPSQEGPKTNNYLGSFVIKLWQDAIDYHMPSGPLQQKVRKALDDAATIYTVDRHDLRQSNLASAATPMSSILTREQRLIFSKKIPNVRPEDIQAATWYFSKDQQGFKRLDRTDDIANVLRQTWNEKRDPGMDARVRDFIRENHPEMVDEIEIEQAAQDMMRQEIALAWISDQLKGSKEQIRKTLGVGNPLEAVMDAGDTTLGIVHRAAKGSSPHIPMTRVATNLSNQAGDLLGQVSRGELPGAVLRYDGNGSSFVSDDTPSGFVVPLVSAGKLPINQKKSTARQIERFLEKYDDLLDDRSVSDHIRFNIHPTQTGGASLDIAIVVPDESMATEIGRAFNQESIYDFGSGRSINVGPSYSQRNISNKEIRKTIHGVFGKVSGQKPTFDEVRERGITLDEMDSVNPISIFQRKVVRPVMERYRTLSESGQAAQSAANAPGPNAAIPVPSPDPTEPFDFSSISDFYQDPANRLLATQEANILSTPDDTGRRLSDQLDEWNDEATADIAALDASGIGWSPSTSWDDRKELLKDRPDLLKMAEKYHDIGIDIRYSDPHSIEMRRLEKQEAKKRGIKHDRQTTGDLLRAAWGEMALFSPKYHTGNMQGAWFANLLAGSGMHQGPDQVIAAFKVIRGGLEDVDRQEAMNSLYVAQISRKWGDEDIPPQVLRGGVRDMTSTSRKAGTSTGELVHRVTKSQKLTNLVSRPLEANSDVALAVDVAGRGAIYGDVLDREMTNAMKVIEDDINTMARKQGLADFEFSQSDMINPVPGGPSAARLKSHLMSMGFNEGYAERAGRNFAEAKKIAKKTAVSEMERVQFSYNRLNIDDFVGKVIPFHYYMSRATRFYGEEVLRHPYLMLNYMRANDGIEDAQNDPGLSARQKGFLRLMQTPLGFTLLMNPDSWLGVNKIFSFDNTYEPDGETTAGGAIRWLKERGLGLYPWIDGMLNLAGMYGDTFEPDLLGIRHKALIGSAVNFLASQAGMAPVDAPYASAMGQARWNVSSFVSQFTPDWLTQPVLPKAGGSTSDATLDTIIESRVIDNNPGLTKQQLLDIMTNTQSPEFQEAYQQAAAAGVIQQLLNFTMPANYRMRESSRDVRSAQTNTIYEAAELAGVSPTEFRPAEGDVEFAARYKSLTGKDWEPGDYAKAKAEADITKATIQQKPFVVQQNEYYSLGTDAQRKVFQQYQDILQGKHPKTAALDYDSRRVLAQAWASDKGYSQTINDIYALREQYESTHVEFAAYKGWRDQMFDLSNHLGGNLGEYRRQASQQNPNAKKYFEDMITYVHQNFPQDQWEKEIEERTTSADAYQSITGKTQGRFDPAPQPGFPPLDVTMPEMQQMQPSSGPNMYNWMRAMNGAATRFVR